MANHNGARFIKGSLKTVVEQTFLSWEALVIDDASTDGSQDIVAALAASDPRIRLVALPVQGGPAAARNVGLDMARGRWAAVMDSDDLIHPDRLERLLAAAERHGCDIAADNMLVFDDDTAIPAYAFLSGGARRTISLADYVIDGADGRGARKLGYLKPLFSMAFIRRTGLRYPTGLRIGEDFSFVRALLAAGARFDVFPDLTYFYRKHAGSISHRLSATAIQGMLADDAAFLATQDRIAEEVVQATTRRRRGFQTALVFDALVRAIKARRWTEAARLAASHKRAALLLRQPVAAWVSRRVRALRRRAIGCRRVCIITPTKRRSGAVKMLCGLLAAHAPVDIVVQRRRPGTMREMARLARLAADIIVVDGAAGMDAVPYTLQRGSLALALLDKLPAAGDFAKLGRADAILLTRPHDVAALQAGCPATPLVLLSEAAFSAFLAAVWPTPA